MSGLPSWSRSVVGTWIAPVRGSRTRGTNTGVFQFTVRFSSSVTRPVNRQPKLPTTMSRSPSPSKSAARASAVRGSLVAIGTVTND